MLEERSQDGEEGRRYVTAAVRARSSHGVDDMGASTEEEDMKGKDAGGRGDGDVTGIGEEYGFDEGDNFGDDMGICDEGVDETLDEEYEEKERGDDGRWYMGFENEGGELRGLTVAARLAPKS